MKMAVLQHVPFEGPAAIADWAAARKIAVTVRHLYRGDPLPELPEFDMLTVMGGPMSANDERVLPWLAPEIARVGEAIASDKIVFGVCLGAQIIAKALGAKVYKGAQKEIGWFPVRAEAAHALFKGLPGEFMAFHWHGETFDLPAKAERLASTPGTANQAFAVGEKILGLQFHMEATKESVNALMANAASEIGAGAYSKSRTRSGRASAIARLFGSVWIAFSIIWRDFQFIDGRESDGADTNTLEVLQASRSGRSGSVCRKACAS